MGILALKADERVAEVKFTRDALVVTLMDGRIISVPLAWYPRLLEATSAQRKNWQVSGGGYGIHWPEIDEDLSTEGLLRGAPAPRATQGTGNHDKGRAGGRDAATGRFVPATTRRQIIQSPRRSNSGSKK